MHHRAIQQHLALYLILVGIATSVLALFALPLIGSAALNASAASGCSTSSPSSSAYTVTVCITSPLDDATVSGATAVTTTVSVTGPTPGLARLVYTLNSQYLLTYFAGAPFRFTLPTTYFVDANYPLSVQAIMGDGFTSTLAAVNLHFHNGITTPPTNTNTFTPTAGTKPPAGQPLILAAVGDGAGGEPPEASVVNLIASWNPNLFIYLGDVYEKGTVTEFYNYYLPSTFYGRFHSLTDPTIGNHEYLTAQATGYFDYWDNVPNYYSFDAGGWHLISLNTNCSQVGGCGTASAQYQWLAQDLAAHKVPCTLVFYHEPLYDVGPEAQPPPPITATWSLVAQSGVDIVLNGHDHNYQRWKPLDGNGNVSPGGITEFIAAAGGHSIQTFVPSLLQQYQNFLAIGYDTLANPVTYGALKLALQPTSVSWQYININGQILDSGSFICSGAPAPSFSLYLPYVSK